MTLDLHLKELELMVWELLRDSKRSRNSDTFLILKVADRLGHNITARVKDGHRIVTWELDLDAMPSFESITRARRKIQAGGQFLPTDPKVCRQRRIKEATMREYYGRH
jgi:hypothetical protein